MISIYYKALKKIIPEADVKVFDDLNPEEILWIDLVNPSLKEKKALESFLGTNLASRQKAEEIESSSRYSETENLVIANSNFLIQEEDTFTYEPVSFILKDGILVSMRNADLRVFDEATRKFQINYKAYPSGFHILVALLETRIDVDADMVESIAREISQVSKRLSLNTDIDEEIILTINQLQENTMLIRENIIDKQRVLSGIMKSERFPTDIYPKLSIMLKDVSSLINHTDFSFERLEYLQNTFLGLINIEQNKIIKIFTVASVVFMPPTLIASVYGMNFKTIPELQWTAGYPFAIGIMIFSSLLTLYLFRRRKWL
jgi:magnesium Mg(2+) and cobalt Co(2+) transport protein (corA)